jgi:ubiquitin-conjugating enzyme E2 G1
MTTPNSQSSTPNLILKRQLIELQKRPVEGFSAGTIPVRLNMFRSNLFVSHDNNLGLVDDDNILEWEVMIIGPPDTL